MALDYLKEQWYYEKSIEISTYVPVGYLYIPYS